MVTIFLLKQFLSFLVKLLHIFASNILLSRCSRPNPFFKFILFSALVMIAVPRNLKMDLKILELLVPRHRPLISAMLNLQSIPAALTRPTRRRVTTVFTKEIIHLGTIHHTRPAHRTNLETFRPQDTNRTLGFLYLLVLEDGFQGVCPLTI